MAAMTREYVPCLYWSAVALERWSKLKGFGPLLRNKDKVKAFVSRVGLLNPDYHYGAVDRYWGGYYAIAPSFAGGDLNKAKVYFDKTIAQHPHMLETKVMMAQYYATKMQNRGLFERLLREVLAANPAVILEIEPENRMAITKARKLLAEVGDYFSN